MNSTQRADGLDGLRGLAAVAVVLLHVWMFSGANQPEQSALVDAVVGSMGLALMMFFVLSGLLVAAPWISSGADGRPAPDLRRYVARRAARILPAYWLCLAGSFALMQRIAHPLAVESSELPLFALFAQNQTIATAGQLNPPLWSLGVEMAFYVALPAIGVVLILAIRRFGRLGALLITTGMIAAGLLWNAYVLAAGEPQTLVAALPTYLPIFACGITAAALLHGRRIGRAVRGTLLAGGALLVFGNGYWHSDPTGAFGHIVRDLPAGVGFAMIAAAVANGPARVLGSAPLRRLGVVSYGIYLWHMPVIYLLRDLDRWPDSPWAAFATVLASATTLGAASWFLVEQPAVRATARRLQRAPRPAVAAPDGPAAAAPARPLATPHGPRPEPEPEAALSRR